MIHFSSSGGGARILTGKHAKVIPEQVTDIIVQGVGAEVVGEGGVDEELVRGVGGCGGDIDTRGVIVVHN